MWLDILSLLFIVYGFIRGFSKGLVMSVISLVAYIVGVMLTIRFSHQVTNLLGWNDKAWAPIAVFLLLFIAIFIVFKIVGKLIEGLLQVIALSFVNKLFGGIVGAVIALVIMSGIVWLLEFGHLINENSMSKSKVYGFERKVGRMISVLKVEEYKNSINYNNH
jgi:membrane protein required for colicin V production